MEIYTYYHSPIGKLLLAAKDNKISGLWFYDQKECPAPQFVADSTDHPIILSAVKWLDIYFCGKSPDFSVPLHIHGTAFQKKVWNILMTIPYGQTVTYGQVAKQIGQNMSAQAVGGAVGHNPISILIPCHRVIGANRKLIGYAGGIDRKRYLLSLEQIQTNSED